MVVGWLDPAIDSNNTGDEIIAGAVRQELRSLIGKQTVHRLPTRRRWTKEERQAARECNAFVVGGTNLLTSRPMQYRQWRFAPSDAKVLWGRCLLFGVGWWQYQNDPDPIARWTIRRILTKDVPHGVRDEYTVKKLAAIGVRSVDISCPTLWGVKVSGQSTSNFRATVVTTLTDYMREPEYDQLLLETLDTRADRLVIWPQGARDVEYVESLGFRRNLIDSGLAALDSILQDPSVEYVGTRLHAAARALQQGVPAVVIEIDNRAAEIAKEVGLWTIPRHSMDRLDLYLNAFDQWDFRLPVDAIAQWRLQVTEALRSGL